MRIDDAGVPGLPRGRLLPDPPAVADRREVRRVRADRSRGRPAPSRRPSSSRSPTASPARASTCCRSSATARPSTSTSSTTSCSEPYPDRFRLILNDLGAGLAARGDELAEIVERSNPALRETQPGARDPRAARTRRSPTSPRDGDSVVSALARERESLAGFINSLDRRRRGDRRAPRRPRGRASRSCPGFLRELRSTMTELQPLLRRGDAGVRATSATRPRR